MLTADLLRVKIYRDRITPRWLDESNPKYLSRAAEFIEIFSNHIGKSRGELERAIQDKIGEDTDYSVQRGLVKLLFDRSNFEVRSPVSPREIRERVFSLSAENYPVFPDNWAEFGQAWFETDGESELLGEVGGELFGLELSSGWGSSRSEILARVGEELGISGEEVERFLYSDLQEAQVLTEFEPLEPVELIRRYNLALAQALLFRAEFLEIEIGSPTPQRLRQFYRYIKFFQLISTAYPLGNGGFIFKIDGPLSLFRYHQKYGLQMAKFLPALLLCEEWSMRALIRWESSSGKLRKLEFSLNSENCELISHYPDKGVYLTEEERHFRENWSEEKLGWKLLTEVEVFSLGSRDTLITDYALVSVSDQRKCLISILGFWHPRWLRKKLELAEEYAPENLLFLVPARLQTDREPLPSGLGERVLFFKGVIRSKKVVEIAEKIAG